MTNDTNTRTKANAVFFAAIMVVSMVAVGFAAAPAAAANSASFDNLDPSTVDEGETVTHDYTFTADGVTPDGNTDTFSVTLPSSASFDTDGTNTATITDGDGSDITVTDTSFADADGGSDNVLQVTFGPDSSAQTGEELTFDGQVTVEFPNVDSNTDVDVTGAIDDSSGDSQEDSQTVTIRNTDGSGQGVTFQVDGDSQSIYYQGQDVNASGLNTNAEYVLRSVDEFDGDNISSSTFESEYDSNETGFIDLDTENLESGDYFLRGPGLDETRDQTFELTVQDFSADWEEDSYDTGEEAAELNTESQRNNYNVIISADGLDYEDLNATFGEEGTVGDIAQDENEDDDEIIVRAYRDDAIEANFSNSEIDAGEYEFDLEVYDTEASDTASLNITEEDTDASFTDSVVTTAAGDVANITVDLEDSDSTYVSIGGEQVGFFDVVYVEDDDDDDEVTFQVNTRTLGTNADEDVYQSEDDIVEPADEADNPATFTSEDDEDTWDNAADFRTDENGLDQSQLARPAQPGEYDLIASSNGEYTVDEDGDLVVENELDISTLDLTDPTVEGVVTHTAPTESSDDAEDASELLEEVTQREDIALDDRLVIQVQADGIEGYVAEESETSLYDLNEGVDGTVLNDLIDDENGQGVNFEVEAEGATANQQPNSLDLNETTVYFADGQFFVVADTSNGDAFDGTVDDGDTFDVTYEYVTDEDNRYNFDTDEGVLPDWDAFTDGDDTFPYFPADTDTVSGETTFTLEERSASFDNENADDFVEVAVNEEASITGTTNVAPGTEPSVRLRSASGVSPQFILTDDDAEIAEDGSFEATIDTTEGEVDNEGTLRFRVGSSNIEEVDAILVEQVSEPASFEVSDLNPEEATATAGDSVTVSATIENTGGVSGTQAVALTLDGDELDSQEVSLDAGNSTTVEFTADTSGLDAGDYEHGISTEDDDATGTLTIEAADDDGDDGTDDGDDGTDDGEDGTDDGDDGTDGEDGDDGGESEDGTPGFGALVALVALIAAALLATRRTE